MFVCILGIPYAAIDLVNAMTSEAYADLRAKLPPGRLPETRPADRWGYSIDEILADDVELETWTSAGIEPTVKKLRGVHYSQAIPNTAAKMLEHRKPGGDVTVNVSTTGVGLLNIRTVTWKEDCCTQELQRALDEGWRIIAACPPNDSRRPTYIIGHTDEGRKDPE